MALAARALPPRLDGLRAVALGPCAADWAGELERRGAAVRRESGAQVDYAVAAGLLAGLRDPVGELEGIRSQLAPGGRLLSVEPVDLPLSLLRPREAAATFHGSAPTWWRPNVRALLDALRVAGFAGARIRGVHRVRGAGWHVAIEAVTRRP